MQWLRDQGVPQPTVYTPDAEDVFNFIAVRSLDGRTIVQVGDCSYWGLKSTAHCECPSNMSYGSVRSLRFALQAAFRDAERGGPFDPARAQATLASMPVQIDSCKGYGNSRALRG